MKFKDSSLPSSWAKKAMSIVASDYDFAYDDKALFEKTATPHTRLLVCLLLG